MRLQGVGARRKADDIDYLDPEWYRSLNDVQLAAYIRYLFIYHREGAIDWDSSVHQKPRPHVDGGRDQYGNKRTALWPKVISAIKRRDAVPGIWVAAHFSGALHSARVSSGKNVIGSKPEVLASDISERVYDDYIGYFPSLINQQRKSAEVSITTRYTITSSLDLPEDDHVLLVLCDKSHVNATPFLRYAFAASLDCQRAANKFIWPAAIEYETKQALYDKYIEDNPECDWFVSPALKKFVVDVRKHWSRYA
jgi:hypothetical protein